MHGQQLRVRCSRKCDASARVTQRSGAARAGCEVGSITVILSCREALRSGPRILLKQPACPRPGAAARPEFPWRRRAAQHGGSARWVGAAQRRAVPVQPRAWTAVGVMVSAAAGGALPRRPARGETARIAGAAYRARTVACDEAHTGGVTVRFGPGRGRSGMVRACGSVGPRRCCGRPCERACEGHWLCFPPFQRTRGPAHCLSR
jgi:hypothetical protein